MYREREVKKHDITAVIFGIFKTGLFAIGGGLATLPFLYNISEKTGWFTFSDIANMIAVSESTPGAIGVNMSTYVGFQTSGILGAITATFGLVFPSVIVIIIISKVLQKFKDSQTVKDAFYGLRPASVGLIAAAGLGVAKLALLNPALYEKTKELVSLFQIGPILLTAAVFVAMRKWKVHPVAYIGIAAVVGVIFKL